MRRFRVSIAGLMVVVLFVAVGVAALREATEVWSGVLFALTVAAMAFAGLRAAYREGTKRAFWAGFALFGSIYLALAFAPGAENRPPLITGTALTWLHPRVARNAQPPMTVLALRNGSLVTTTWVDVSTQLVQPAPGMTGSGVALTDFDSDGTLDVTVSPNPTAPRLVRRRFAFTTSDPTTFARVGHCLLAVIVAMLGGVIARRQWTTGTRIAAVPPPPTPEDPPCPAAVN